MKKILSVILFLSGYCQAQTGVFVPGSQKADSLITAFMTKWGITGGTAALSSNGKLIFNGGFGFTSRDHKLAASPGTRFRVASVSKPLTAIAIMKLAQENKLKVQDTVFGVHGLLKNSYYLDVISDPRIYHITVQDLLEHTGGWDRMIPAEGFSHSDWPFHPVEVSRQEQAPYPVSDSTLIRHMLRQKLNYDPGKKFAYSNVGYLILGKIIQEVSGQSYADYMIGHIFSPLSACDLAIGKTFKHERLSREAEYISEYTAPSINGDGKTVSTPYGGFNLEAMNAHGGWIASASDLVRILLSIDQYDSAPDLLSNDFSSAMTEPGRANPFYAKGWSVNEKNNWWHTGSLEGTASFICRTAGGYTWAFLFNGRGDNSAEFWNDFDKLPWMCIATMRAFPDIDLFAPTTNVSGFRQVQTGPGTFKINWIDGNGKGRLILASENSEIDSYPVDGNSYKGGRGFGTGSYLGDKTVVVYNGSGNECTLSGLEAGKTYTICGVEYELSKQTFYQEVYKLGCAEQAHITPELLPLSMP